MHKRLVICLLCVFLYVTISTLFSPLTFISAEQFLPRVNVVETDKLDEETNQILQSSLSIIEIDKEIARLQIKANEVQVRLSDLDIELAEQELLLVEKKEAAGEVIRSYYMGERFNLLMSIFSSKSLDSFLRKLEFYEFVMAYDKNALDSYKAEQINLELSYATYLAEQIALDQAQLALQQKREEVLKLERDINHKLGNRDDSERILLLIDELKRQWNEEGMAKVEHYLYLLTDAMLEFPKWLQNQTEYTKVKGLSYTVNLPEQALNTFLRDQHPDFEHFSFQFEDNQIVARGKDNDMEIVLKGSYTIINEPKHFIQFTISSLQFNSFSLPQTTIDELMVRYDLNFYPALIVSFLQATEVILRDGFLYIQLKLKI